MNEHINTIDVGHGWMAKTKAAGTVWALLVQACGGRATSDNGCVAVTMQFTPGDTDAFNAASSLAHDLLCRCPCTRSGSVWGVDGVGGMIAIDKGTLTIHKSGVSKNFAAGVS